MLRAVFYQITPREFIRLIAIPAICSQIFQFSAPNRKFDIKCSHSLDFWHFFHIIIRVCDLE